ncbi:hypothetical protein FB567DRAFT_292813 [Paraphoma chrysanthemicola]|uniref:F-box domain-containing protein n=1 Tax=Paraphoma chrysanthemicola TaxID=798071 RepID=A0A8K0RA65_9PLEO|nr:hypothetical protein FB567DRAFT_292813 [Paraphoma chrysanthemicola]
MNKIPPEILAHVLEQIPKELNEGSSWRINSYHAKLACYATVSRSWRACIERVVFKELTVTTEELSIFIALFRGKNIARRAYLSTLYIVFLLPPTLNPLGCCPVTRVPNRLADSQVFSASVAEVFAILADLEARAIVRSTITLYFFRTFRKPEPGMIGREYNACSALKFGASHYSRDIREAQAVSGQYELVHEEFLPMLYGIEAFKLSEFDELRYLKHSCISKIVGRLPNVERLSLATEDSYERGRNHRLRRRESFAKSICSLMGDQIRQIRIISYHHNMGNESSPVHRLVDHNTWDQDSWFRIFNHFATFPNLAILEMTGGLVVCLEFFRGIVLQADAPFPALVQLQLEFAPETADGRWFHVLDEDTIQQSRNDPKWESWWEEEDEEYDESDDGRSLSSQQHAQVYEDGPFRTEVVRWNQFRSLPDSSTMLPFLLDASKAISRITTLRKFILKIDDHFEESQRLHHYPIVRRVFELWYVKAGTPRSPKDAPRGDYPKIIGDAAYLHRNRLYWRVNGWKPWDELQASWQSTVGEDAKIVFLEEDNWVTQGNNSMLLRYEGIF